MAEIRFTEFGKSLGTLLPVDEEGGRRMADAFVGAVKDSLQKGKRVSISGFGRFTIKEQRVALLEADVAGEMASRLEEDESRIRPFLESVGKTLRRELLSGKRIVFDDIGVFEIRCGRPRVEKRPLGRSFIRPVRATLCFTAPSNGSISVLFQEADEFRREIVHYRETILAVAPEKDFFIDTLEYSVIRSGWAFEFCTNSGEVMERVGRGRVRAMVLDAAHPEAQQMALRVKLQKETTRLPLLLLFPGEQALQHPADLTVLGDENLAQPFEMNRFLDLVDACLVCEEETAAQQQVHLCLPTEERAIECAIERVRQLIESSGIDENGGISLNTAFREGVVNAAQHGNRYRRDKRIEVRYELDREKIVIAVGDSGSGFNSAEYVRDSRMKDAVEAARSRYAQGRLGGLGIILMLRCCDRVEYNDAGNQITLTKYLSGPPT